MNAITKEAKSLIDNLVITFVEITMESRHGTDKSRSNAEKKHGTARLNLEKYIQTLENK